MPLQWSLFVTRVLLVGLIVIGIVGIAVFSVAFFVWLALPVLLLAMQPRERRNAVLDRGSRQ